MTYNWLQQAKNNNMSQVHKVPSLHHGHLLQRQPVFASSI